MSFQLKRVMSERGVNITELSKMTGITNANISNMIHGKTSPNLDTIERIADALGVEAWTLLKSPDMVEGHYVHCPKCGAKLQLTEVE